MYRCILVHPEDQDMQRILWRENINEPVHEFRLKTITYGTASASFLATNCLNVLAEEIADSHPAASLAISKNFYMDDLLTGAESVESAKSLQNVIHTTLEKAHFPL